MISILAGPALLGFPYSMIGLTWGGGVPAYLIVTAVFIYCNVLIAKVHQAINQRDGVRYHRYRDLAGAVFGKCRCQAHAGRTSCALQVSHELQL